MAQFRSSADILDLALAKAGEVTNGNSPYETQALDFLNRVHFALIAGGTIPLAKDEMIEVDELWPWARSTRPIILELQPKVDSGTVTLTLGSDAITFSSAPTVSVAGWYLRITGRDEILRIASHAANSTSAELDGAYPDSSGSSTFTCAKLDYELTPSYLVIDTSNNKTQVQKAAGVTLTGTLTAGSYTPAQLATHVAAVMTTTLSGPTVTGAYDSVTRKFTFTSDLAGATSFIIVGNGTSAQQSVHRLLGFDDILTASAAAQTSVYPLGGIARLIEPMKLHKDLRGSIYGVDTETLQRDFPLTSMEEGFPCKFAVINETSDGILTVRFDKFVQAKTRIEIDYAPVPHDLKDDATSIPLVPRKHVDVLEDATVFYLMLTKSDDRATTYAQLLGGKLKAMISQNRGQLQRSGTNFGEVIARRDLYPMPASARIKNGGYT